MSWRIEILQVQFEIGNTRNLIFFCYVFRLIVWIWANGTDKYLWTLALEYMFQFCFHWTLSGLASLKKSYLFYLFFSDQSSGFVLDHQISTVSIVNNLSQTLKILCPKKTFVSWDHNKICFCFRPPKPDSFQQ